MISLIPPGARAVTRALVGGHIRVALAKGEVKMRVLFQRRANAELFANVQEDPGVNARVVDIRFPARGMPPFRRVRRMTAARQAV